jgi:D-amino-acid oxidase
VVENPGVETFFAEYDDSPTPTYFLPHENEVVLGGSAEPGRLDEKPNAQLAADIRRRCAAIEPRLASAPLIEHRVGMRPSRPRVRLEAEHVDGGVVVHNYGHGGAGVTMSWGCAYEVVNLIERL